MASWTRHLPDVAVNPRAEDAQRFGTLLVPGMGQATAQWLLETRVLSDSAPGPECSLTASTGRCRVASLARKLSLVFCSLSTGRHQENPTGPRPFLSQPPCIEQFPGSQAGPRRQQFLLGLLSPPLSTRSPSFLLASTGLSWVTISLDGNKSRGQFILLQVHADCRVGYVHM